ncbi:uncharacterized protein LOC110464391 [Mizuhopecten yessoensis]|uniref:Ig-like domain-containing protein n=1 Tax=Mizuhopecten yessoensis TaxID=6573 RepID=A0A210PTY8_MIZYE|nr:uncharacterized protein LOC110464391 [Mizuhopecten yessoensis]OWF39916.1 hypothetical protein KP79_PYT04253 [Mizuhopecten yessoensis]
MFTLSMDKCITVLLCGTAILAQSQWQWIQPLDIQSNSNSSCVPVGHDLVITCTRNPKPEATGPEQRITVKKQLMGSSTTILPMGIKQGVEVLLPNVTLNDTAIYTCCLGDDCVGLNFVIGELPPAPQDFECVIYDVYYMECTWTSSDKCVTWSVQYETVPSYPNRYDREKLTQTACDGTGTPLLHGCNPKNNCSDHTKCIRNVWSLEIPQLDVVYKISLTGSGIYGVATYYYNISTSYVIEKLGNLYSCSSLFNGSTVEIGCKFPLPPTGFENGLRCKITAESIYSTRYDTIEYTVGNLSYRLEDSHPYTFYNMSLTCQVNKSLYWGNPFIYQFTTPQDVPLVGPSTSNQSYTVWCKADKPHVSIYIQHPSAYQTQGILTGYNMKIESSADCWNQSFVPNKTTLMFSSMDFNMCGTSVNYDVTIWSQTSEGDSKEGTHLSISANPTHMVITEVIVEETNSGYRVSWKGQSNQSNKCVYHWCISDRKSQGWTDNVTCLGRYNFNETTGRHSLIPLDTDDGLLWKFGVSQNGTGIRWQDCVFSNGPPIRKPDRLDNESTIELPEKMAFCSKTSQKGPKPLEYLVLYSDIERSTSKHFTVNASMRTSFNGIHLIADTLYTVKYKIIYSNGRQSEFSDAVSFKTPTKAPAQQRVSGSSSSTTEVWKVAGGIMGAIAFLIIALILIYTANWRWKNMDDKIEDVSVQPPDITESYKEKFGTITYKTPDSGRGTLSSTNTSLNDNQLQRATIPSTPRKPQNRLPVPCDIHDVSQTNHGFLVSNDEESAESEQVPFVPNGTVDSTEADIHNSQNLQFFNDNVKFERNQNADYVQVDQLISPPSSPVDYDATSGVNTKGLTTTDDAGPENHDMIGNTENTTDEKGDVNPTLRLQNEHHSTQNSICEDYVLAGFLGSQGQYNQKL